jgi:hypothetical protein
MTPPLTIAFDLVAVAVMTFGLYFPRHRRRDMVVAYLVVNLGLVAVTLALSASTVSAALGFGLFAVLSIIRLRSAELDHPEIAYYFASMTLGLLGGLVLAPAWLAPTMMLSVLVALFVGDHPRLFAHYRVQTVTLDAAYTDEGELIARLERLLAATVHRVTVRRVDLVEATTVVEVRYQRRRDAPRGTVQPVTADGRA